MKKILLGICSFFMAITLVACGGGDKGGKSGEKTVTFAKENDVISMDSTYATDGFSFEVIAATVDGLMSVDADGNIIPAIAKETIVSEDGLTYTFKLRDAKWDNGEKVTAADFVYAWQETVSNPAAEYNYLYTEDGASVLNAAEIISGEKDKKELGVKAIDEKTFEVTLSKSVSYFESLMTFPVFYPVNQKFFEAQNGKYALTPDKLLSNGPYKMTQWEKTTKIVLEKNDKYWDAKNVKTDKLVFNIIADFSTAALDFESGSADHVRLNRDLVDKYKDDKAYKSVLEGYLWYLQYNFGNEYLKNENLRMALSLAVDKKDLTENVLKDGSIAATGFVPKKLATGPDGKDYRETAPTYLASDEAKAKEYWAKAKSELGVDKLSLRFLFEGTDPAKPAAEYIQSQLEKKLDGLTIEMISQPKDNRIEMQKARDFDVVLTRWGPDYADPTTYLSLMVTGNSYNYGDYTSQEYDAKMKEASEATDLSKRWSLLQEAEGIAMKDVAVAPIFQVGGATLVNPDVSGVENHLVGVPYRYKNVVKK